MLTAMAIMSKFITLANAHRVEDMLVLLSAISLNVIMMNKIVIMNALFREYIGNPPSLHILEHS